MLKTNLMPFEDWLKSRNGKLIDLDGFPAHNIYQCWDLMADKMRQVDGVPARMTVTRAGGTRPHAGYACNVFHNAATAGLGEFYHGISPDEPARRGDIVFWDMGRRFPGSHVAIVLEDKGESIVTLSQNPGPAQVIEFKKFGTGLLGFLRPKRDQPASGGKPTPPDLSGKPKPEAPDVVPFPIPEELMSKTILIQLHDPGKKNDGKIFRVNVDAGLVQPVDSMSDLAKFQTEKLGLLADVKAEPVKLNRTELRFVLDRTIRAFSGTVHAEALRIAGEQ